MTWVLLILLGLIAIPVTTELMRTGMSDAVRSNAPGEFALLSQGTTHYEWLGPERGAVAVCVHGLTTPSYVWYGMARGLALLGFRVLIYDQYGRGFSDRIGGKQTAAFFNQQLTDLLSHQNVTEPVTLLGYSMGGAVAAHFTALHPERVKQLILLAPAGMMQLGGRKIALTRDLPVIGDWLFLAGYPWVVRRGIAAEAHVPSSVTDIYELQQVETGRRGYFPAVLSSLRGLLRNTCEDQHKAIAAAGVPVLAVWGDTDDVIPLSCKDTLAAWNPAALQSVVTDAGHGLPHTHTDAVIDAIRGSRG
ncbi:alpha/beta hydrolase [uncultured Tateyamaria sp.]|uniref:alpha/beta fold hydrolase n=1 Tax=uncultured Tateyamaria sp. TaxID=455651 RepID=UPI00262A2A7D|nr:alpha/beta hydrolase [uncultured Tateyamaria sp.]